MSRYNFGVMKLYVIYNYKDKYPELKGHDLTDALIRQCIGDDEDVICRTDKGKPYISSYGPNADADPQAFSVSHSESTFALLAAEDNVGLDIQYARKVRADRIAARIFTAEEVKLTEEDETDRTFYMLWTRKEALSKYTGEGIELLMRQEPVIGRADVSFTDIILEDGCFCAVCTGAGKGDESYEIQISYRE